MLKQDKLHLKLTHTRQPVSSPHTKAIQCTQTRNQVEVMPGSSSSWIYQPERVHCGWPAQLCSLGKGAKEGHKGQYHSPCWKFKTHAKPIAVLLLFSKVQVVSTEAWSVYVWNRNEWISLSNPPGSGQDRSSEPQLQQSWILHPATCITNTTLLIVKSARLPVLLWGAFWGWLRKEKISKQWCVYPDTHQALAIECVTCTDWPGTPPAIVWKSSPDYSPTMALFGWNCRYLCWAFSFSTVPWLVLFNWVLLN